MSIRKSHYIAIITLALFVLGLFNINGLQPALADDKGMDISFTGLEEIVLSGDINFNVKTKVASNSDIDKGWKLGYKLMITKDNAPTVGQTVYYGQNFELSTITGDIFIPQENFTLKDLQSESGLTTKFKTNLPQGSYSIELSLVKLKDDGDPLDTLGKSQTSFFVSEVKHSITLPAEAMKPGLISPITVKCQVGRTVYEEVYLKHKLTITRNGEPIRGHIIKESKKTQDYTTNNDGAIYLDVENLEKLKNPGVTLEFSSNLQVGEYLITAELIELKDGREKILGMSTRADLSLQRYPTLIEKYPDANTSSLSNDNLFPLEIDGVMRYFIRLSYALDGNLQLSGNAFNSLNGSTVYSVGGSRTNIVDTDFLKIVATKEDYINKYIFVKDNNKNLAYLYIPIKPLRPQTSYEVKVLENIIYYDGGNSFDGSGNKAETWVINTMAVPTVTGLTLGSVGENYDIYEPIIIGGSYFDNDNISVLFNDTPAYNVVVHNNGDKGYLEVFLPRGRDRLKPGLYNISVLKNNKTDYSQTLYGKFSVVKASDLPLPQDGVRVTSEREGEVSQSVKSSSASLSLRPSAANQGYLYLDLDKLMGEQTVARSIKLPNDGRTIAMLSATSKYADINVHNLRPDLYVSTTDDLVLRLGRVEATVIPILHRNMLNSAVKSEFIEVAGENITFDNVEVEMNYNNSDGQRIRVLRYDETYRQWFEQPFTKDLLNRQVNLSTDKAGIFVVVE